MSEYFVGTTGSNSQTTFESLTTSEVLDDLGLNTSDAPTFSGLFLDGSGSTIFSVDGSNGRLFGVTDEVTGTVFSVNDAAGLPIVEVESTSDFDKITLGEYGSDLLVLSGQTTAEVTGSQIATQSWISDQGFSADTNYYLTGIEKSSNTLNFKVRGSSEVSYTFGSNAFNSTTIPSAANDATITISAGTALGGGGNFTTDQSANETITINHDSISRSDTTSSVSLDFGDTVTGIDSITSNAQGHITAENTVTYTLPSLTSGDITGALGYTPVTLEDDGSIESEEFIGDLRGAVSFKAQAGEAIAKGEAVFISGISGNTTVVGLADANDATRMPAFGIASEAASANNPVTVINFGSLGSLDTDTPSWDEGDELYVSNTAGALTTTPPTSESSLLQKIAKVTRRDNAAGSITVMGAGRTNAVPNLNEGRLFVGNSSNQAVADGTIHVDIADGRVGIGTTDPHTKLHINDGVNLNLKAGGSGSEFQIKATNDADTAYIPIITRASKYSILNGNVGIGTTSPTANLQVGNDYTINASYGGSLLYIKGSSVNTSYDPQTVSTSDIGSLITISDSTTTGPTKAGLVLYNDDVTVGGFSPMLLFSKRESGSSPYKATMAGIYARSPLGTGDSNSWIDGELIFATAGAASQGIKQRMVIDKEGNVGIGDTTPSYKLDVAGDIRATGDLRADDDVFIAGDVLRFTNDAASAYIQSADALILEADYDADDTGGKPITFKTAGTTKMTIAGGGDVTINNDLIVSGDLTVNGTTSTINSTTLQVDDKNIELGTVASPTDITADGGGITLKGSTDKTINWINSTGAWTFSEDVVVLGTVKASSYFLGSSTEISLATTGAGSVFLRPNGQSTSGQMQLASTGNATFAGKITSGNDIVNATAGVYTWVGDTDTYIQRSAGNEITIKTGASNALVLDSSQNATFGGNIIASGAVYPATSAAASLGLSDKQWAGLDLSSSSAITWGNGDAEIVEGETNNYSLTFKTYDGSANSAALRLDGDNTATFTGSVTATSLIKSGGTSSEFLKADGTVDSTSYLPLAGGTITGNVKFNDNAELQLGSGSDLKIYHNAQYSYLDQPVGLLRVSAPAFEIVNADKDAYIARFFEGGNGNENVQLYYSGSKKFETATNGVNVTGNVIASNNVYAGGANGFVFGSSTSEGEYIYRSGDDIRVHAGGSDRLTVDGDDGRVGIGTTSPSGELHVKSASTNANLYIQRSTYDPWRLSAGSTYLAFVQDTSEKMRITEAGNFGIGTESPNTSYGLNVVNSTYTALFESDDAVAVMKLANTTTGTGTTNGLEFYANGLSDSAVNAYGMPFSIKTSATNGTNPTARLTVSSGGNVVINESGASVDFRVEGNTDANLLFVDGSADKVGIGTTTPNNKLQVNYAPVAIASLTATSGTASTNWNRNAGLMITGASVSNALAFGASGTANDRKAWIQVGHPDTAANSLGDLALNPLGGNVGIGTTSPSKKLHVLNSTNEAQIRLGQSGSGSYDLGVYANDTFSIGRDADTQEFNIKSGNVGIGTTSPSSKLQVYTGNQANANQGITLVRGAGLSLFGFKHKSDANGVYRGAITFDTTEAMTFLSNGNVGIGTTTPSAKLEVNGHFAATTKSFIVDNPKTGGKLQYGVVESDQHSVFVRGKNDTNTIELPEEWEWLVDEDSVTVQLTSIGQIQQLFVISQDNKTIKIGGLATNGKYNYTVYGERKDVEKLEVNI